MKMSKRIATSRPAASRGAVMVITLFATVLLAGLLFFVINLGRQVNDRVEVQHAADASVEAGATWVARSLNTISRNNIAISRHIANVNVLDSFPDATEAAYHEMQFLDEHIDASTLISSTSSRLNSVVRVEVGKLDDNLAQETAELMPVASFFDRTDVTSLTHYESDSGRRGQLWQAMHSLDQYSNALAEQLGDLAHVNAAAGGNVNLARDNQPSSSLLLPVSPQLPIHRGRFNDFKRPVLAGQLPDAINDDVDHRGPYDTVFGWRRNHYERGDPTGGPTSPGTTGGVNGGGGSPVGGGPGNHGGSGPGYEWIIDGYQTFGTQGRTWQSNPGTGWAYGQIAGFISRRERINLIDGRRRYYNWLTQQADVKLNYVWPHPSFPYGDQFARPVWSSSYPSNLPQVGRDLPFSETAYYRLDIKSKYPRGSSQFMASSNTWAFEMHQNRRSNIATNSNFFVVFHPGWWLRPYRNDDGEMQYPLDPVEINPYYENGNFTKVGDRAWLNEFDYTVNFDLEIDIEPEYDDEENIIPQQAYFIQVVIYAGINTNPVKPGVFNPNGYAGNDFARDAIQDDSLTWTIANPYRGFDRNDDDAPAPLDIDHDAVGVGSQGAQQRLEYLAITRRNDHALLWPGRFQGEKPYPNIVSIAQAQVFNDHSWDLWTPMWQSRLQKVNDYDQWLEVLESAAEEGEDAPSMRADQIAALRDYMNSTQLLAPAMLNH